MQLESTPIKDLVVLTPTVFEDSRGHFFESYNKQKFEKLGIKDNFVQDNQSFSSYGTLRGLHLQLGDHAQSKLVRVLSGEVLDVALDLRKGSETYGQHFSIKLTAEAKNMLYIPRGFAHGFAVISETAIFSYKCDNFYNKESESGVLYNDPSININWQIPEDKILLSDKDLLLPSFKDFQTGQL